MQDLRGKVQGVNVCCELVLQHLKDAEMTVAAEGADMILAAEGCKDSMAAEPRTCSPQSVGAEGS